MKQGLREELAARPESRYSDLVAAHQLQTSHAKEDERQVHCENVAEDTAGSSDDYGRKTSGQMTVQTCAEGDLEGQQSNIEVAKTKGFFGSMRLMISAMRQHRLQCVIIFVGCMGAGAATAANSVIVASFITAFQTSAGDRFMSRGRLCLPSSLWRRQHAIASSAGLPIRSPSTSCPTTGRRISKQCCDSPSLGSTVRLDPQTL